MTQKTIAINGNNFSDIEGFYNEMEVVLTFGLNWKTGPNLNAFNDLPCGGFGVYEYDEPINLVWANSHKSKMDLNTRYNNETM